jgi:drug/metabolite transporter (DMT)-like permease
MNPRWSGAALVLALILLSHAAIFIRMAEAHALAILFWRLLMALPIMALIVYKEIRTKTEPPLMGRADRIAIWGAGVLLFIHFVSFFVAVQRTSVAASNILFTLNPVTTAAGAWLLHRHSLQLRLAASMTLGILGVLALFGPWLWSESSTFDLWGGLMGVLSAVSFSAYLLTSRQVRRRLSNPRFTLELWTVALILAGISMLIFDIPFLGYSDKTWWAFLALAWLPTLLGHAIFTWCLNHFDINALSCATLSEPIIAAAVAYWLFGENLSFAEVLAFLLTSASIALLTWPWLRGQWNRRLGENRSQSEAQL